MNTRIMLFYGVLSEIFQSLMFMPGDGHSWKQANCAINDLMFLRYRRTPYLSMEYFTISSSGHELQSKEPSCTSKSLNSSDKVPNILALFTSLPLRSVSIALGFATFVA